MKSTLVLLFTLLLASIDCNDKSKRQKSMEEDVHPSDSACKAEIAIAKSDIKNKKFVYCNYVGNIIYQALRAENEMQSLLKENGIEYYNERSPCVIEENRNYHCYCEFMQEKINEKFGKKFTDSLLDIADSLYVFRNLSDTFHYSKCDTWPRFPGEYEDMEYSYKLQDTFNAKVKYPKDYIYAKNYDDNGFVDVSFIVDKNGNVSDLGFRFIYEHEKNEKHEAYFMSVIEPLITEIKWQPATIRNQIVISDMNIRIEFK